MVSIFLILLSTTPYLNFSNFGWLLISLDFLLLAFFENFRSSVSLIYSASRLFGDWSDAFLGDPLEETTSYSPKPSFGSRSNSP